MPLITPPFRTSLLTANGVPFATDNGDIQTTKDWWLYWNQLTDRSNSNSKLASEGSHADRPAPDGMPDGALYYESDRGVLYSNTNGEWKYVAGTMWGTAGGPDQRPTDLDAADVGFDFRTNVSPAREFIWSGGRWIEVTPMLYGTHAQRIAGTIADLWAGMAWMETDRGNVIYQNQSFLWIYAAGVMVAALASRPTDLATNDAGFRFETTDGTQFYRWSGSAWTNLTPPAPPLPGDVQHANSTGNLTLTTTPAAIPGASLVLNRDGRYLITGNFTFAMVGIGDALKGLRGGLLANGVSQAGGVIVALNDDSQLVAATQQWIYQAATVGQTVLLQANKDAGTGSSLIFSPFTSITAQWISP